MRLFCAGDLAIKIKTVARTTVFSETSEGVNLTNSDLMVLGYGNRAILSNGFRLAPSQRGHVSARESKMIKILTLLKLIIEVLLTLLR